MMMDRQDKMFFYERFAEKFDAEMNMYDLRRRLEVVFDELLEGHDLKGKSFLDAGCGTGHFSKMAKERGAFVISLDVGTHLLHQAKNKSDVNGVVSDVQKLCFDRDTFDYVLSTEVIEHTQHPENAVSELIRILKPGGILIIAVPNRIWHFSIRIANKLKLRPYEGYERWLRWSEIRKMIKKNDGHIIEMKGFHLFPFVFQCLDPCLRTMDRFGNQLGPVMLNIAVKITK